MLLLQIDGVSRAIRASHALLGTAVPGHFAFALGVRGVREALALAVSVQHSTYGEDSQVSLFLGAPLRTAGRGFQHRGDVCVNTGS